MGSRDIIRLLVVANVIATVFGHGYMEDPPSRNSAWRKFPQRPKQFTDNELNCGGFSVQWPKNKGKCGVCGDPYHIKNAKYVYPGKYADDPPFITKTYREGETIEVKIKITSNHQGSFRFSLGRLVKRPITQDQLTHVLLQPDGSNRWQLHTSSNGKFHIKLVLPKGLTCDYCVLQWWWRVGNNWGCNGQGDCGVGLNKQQETFVNCADIRILPKGAPAPTTAGPGTDSPMSPSTRAPTTKVPWTQKPSTQGPQTGKCKATGAWAGQANMDRWCASNCAMGDCPPSHCICT